MKRKTEVPADGRLSRKDRKTLLKSQQGELDAVLMYNRLAEVTKNERDRAAFLRLAKDEDRHASVFYAFTNRSLAPKKTKAVFVPLLYRVLGRKAVLPLIAKGEYDAEKKYESVVGRFPEVEAVKNDEQHHGDAVLALLDS